MKIEQHNELSSRLDEFIDTQYIESLEADEQEDNHRNIPRPDPACLYGIIKEIAEAGSNNTEANTYAVAAAAIAYIATALGRGPYLPIGDDWNHARLFFVHVGRSSRGRKGTAKKLIFRINKVLKQKHPYLSYQIHRGGLSTREGLALMIHDGYKNGKEDVPPISDKRLLVVESEFANVLHQSKRDGNTLSAALRDAWDGTSIRPAVKTARVWASNPHIGILADITPSELLDLMNKRELSNGFANRFIFFWAEGEKVLPFPYYTPKETVELFADRIAEILQFAGADRYVDRDVFKMEFSAEAKVIYAKLYRGELRDRSAGERVTGLLDRRAPVLLRLAIVFALTDLTYVIQAQHIKAAMAWIRYWTDSVKFIFQSASDEASAAMTSDAAQRIVKFLQEQHRVSRTELSKECFQGRMSKDTLDAALDELLTASPPVIEVEVVPRTQGQPGSPSKYYKLSADIGSYASDANSAKSANSVFYQSSEAANGLLRNLRNVRTEQTDTQDFADFAQFAPEQSTPNAIENIDISQISLNSQGASGRLPEDNFEVI